MSVEAHIVTLQGCSAGTDNLSVDRRASHAAIVFIERATTTTDVLHVTARFPATVWLRDNLPQCYSTRHAELTRAWSHSAHVHLNEPGRTDWEGFWTGTRAAASGGVTTVVDMPLNSIPPTTTVANLEAKRAAARGQCWTDVAFWGGVIPHNEVCCAQCV